MYVKNRERLVVNNNYMLDVKTKEIRECKFTFGEHQDSLIDCSSLGEISMFRTFNCDAERIYHSPVYYVDNLT